MTYLLQNLSWILPSIIAIVAIAIPIYYQYYRKNSREEGLVDPEVIITVIAGQNAKIQQVTEENRSLQTQLNTTKLLVTSTKNEFSKHQLNYLIQEILKSDNIRYPYPELRDILSRILDECKDESDIVNLFKKQEEHNYIFDLLNTNVFKDKICRILVEIYFDLGGREELQHKASLLWTHIMNVENIKSFTYSRTPRPREIDYDQEKLITYLWSIVNIGFEYYTNNTFFSFRDEFSQKFRTFLDTPIIDELVRYTNSENPKIVQAAAGSLVWLTNARNEKKKPFWQPNEDQLEILFRSFTRNNCIYGIKYLVSILNFACEKTNAFYGNYSYDCAFALDNDSVLSEVEWEPINEELTNIIYLKYISSSDEIKDILAKYLAKYGYQDVFVASRLLTKYYTEKDDDFILSVLMPYISVNVDKGLIGYMINWLRSGDKKIVFYGLLLRKIFGEINTEIIAKLQENRHFHFGLLELPVPEPSQLQLFETHKTKALYNVIKLMGDYAYIVRGTDSTKREAWYYVLINPCMERPFKEKNIGDTYNLEDFGKVIVSQYGKNPPIDIDEMIFDIFA